MMSKTFCINPWNTAHVRMTQGYNPCCLFSDTYQAKDVVEYANGTELADLKSRMLAGERVPECMHCWVQEDQGNESKRQRDNKVYEKIFQYKFKNRELEPNAKFGEYYIRLGNHCNLSCTTCSVVFSTGWISEYKKIGIQKGQPELLESTDPIWQHIKDNAKDVAVIEFVGGEPFMMCQESQKDLFKCLVDSGHASHIKIRYNTNGTRLPVEQLEYWSQFKAVEIIISVDGVGDQFEYLRYPAKWSQVEQHIKFYKNLKSTTVPKLELTVIHTVSIINIGYIGIMLEYCTQQDLKIFINIVEIPKILGIFSVVPAVKSWISQRIKDIDHPVVVGIAKNLNQGANNVTGQDILNFLAPLDQRRNLNVGKTFPELVECLKSVT